MPVGPNQALLHYRLIKKLGEGGMGAVWRAVDTSLDREVAIKVLPESGLASRDPMLARFEREAKLLASFNHANIAAVYGLHEADGSHFIAMELVAGEDLAQRIHRGPLSIDDALRISVQVAEALAAAHDRGVIHRDLKPANVMLTPEGTVKVLDFGLAKRTLTSDGEVDTTQSIGLTQDGVVLGTVPYMSPEQIEGRVVDHRADLFSFGVVLYELVTGVRPFRGDSVPALISSILRDDPPPVHAVREHLPASLGRIIERCLAKQPALRWADARELAVALREAPDAPPARGIGGATRQPFVGREYERAELDAALDHAKSGRGALILLGGEPGVGKTRLAAEVLADGRARGFLALTGHAYEEGGAPHVTVMEILEGMVREVPPDALRAMLGDSAGEISRILPELRQRFPDIPAPQELPPEQQRRHLFNAVIDFLRRASAARPMVILSDDLHWADESSLLLLEHLALHLTHLPVLVLGTYRDVELDVRKPFEKSLARLVRQSLARRLPLKRLAANDLAALFTELGGADPPAELVRAVFAETDGNPFFANEVFQHLAEEDRLFDATGAWRRDLAIDQLDVPEGVRLVIGRRLERLAAGTPKVLTTAAVIGLRFDLAVLQAAVGGDDEVVLDAIDEAVAAKLLVALPAGREVRYEFAHTLVRHTLLGGLSTPRQQRVHLAIADGMKEVLGRRAAERAADLAHHLYEAGGLVEPARVRRYLVLAGKAAQASAAAEEAEGSFDRALETLEFEEEPDAMERADNLFLRGLARRTLGRWEEAARDWDEALPILEARGHSELVARICRDLAYKNVWENRSAEAHALVDRGLRAVGEAPSGARCRLLAIRSYAFSVAGEIAEAETANEAAVAMAEALGDEALLAGEVLLARMYLQQHSFRFAKMATSGERAIEILRRLDRPWDLSNALGGTLLAWAMQGRFDVVAQHIGESGALAQREGDLGNRFHIHCVRSFLEMSHGRPPAARDNLQAAVGVAREAGFPWDSIAQALQGVAELKSGDWEAARATLDDAQTHAVEGTWRGIEASARLLGLVYTEDPEAPALLERLLPDLPSTSVVGRSGAWSMVAPVVEAALLLGKPEVAAELHSVLLRAIDVGCVVFWGFGLTERLAGMASAAAGRRETAQRHFATALEQAESLPYAVDRPEILLWRARLCVDRDASERARDLAAARVDYERFGMARHVAWVDETLTDLEY